MQFAIPYLIVINALALYFMYQDKRNAKKRQLRIPEAVLLGTALLGGSLGGTLGMILFHHKTRKPRFSIGLPVILVVQAVFLLIE